MANTLSNMTPAKSTPYSPYADAMTPVQRRVLLCLIIVLVVFARIRLLDVPLERDEGEYAYIGQQLLQGFPPFSTAYTMKFPGTPLMYALMLALFGQTGQGIHLGFLLLNCATVLLLYFLCKRLANDVAAITASGVYAVLSLSPSVFGFAAHATHFVVLSAVGGALVLLRALEKNRALYYFLSGILFGLSYLMKQPGIFFAAFGVTYAAVRLFDSPTLTGREKLSKLALLLFSTLLPLLVIMAWLSVAGVFGTFWFWTVQYAAKYGSHIPLSLAFAVFWHNFLTVADGFSLLWIAAGLGVLVILFHRDLQKSRMFFALYAVFSFLSICPGFYFREHYFVTLLPAVSISAGIFFNYVSVKSVAFLKAPQLRFLGLGIFLVVALTGIMNQKEYFTKDDPVIVSQKRYGHNPFSESPEIARFIEARSSPADKILVLGSEPQIYFYSKRLSATGHIYMYGLMEKHSFSLSMQKELIGETESAKPKFVVVVNVGSSWVILPESEKFIFGWMANYLKSGYALVGVADIQRPGPTVYKWFDDIKNYTIRSPSQVFIYERR
jgi:dolichyl-phosphate-mannose-protein mannosyltransferase